MPYDEFLAERIRGILERDHVAYTEQRMMGGLSFMVDEKMCVGILTDKTSGQPRLISRIGPEMYEKALEHESCEKFDLTGREMKGFVFVNEDGFDREDDLEYWVRLALEYNPRAKSSKKKWS